MIAPPAPRAYMSLRQARVVRNAPSRWIASIFFHSARLNSSTALTIWMPAFDTRMSTLPKASTTAATPASTSASSVTSILTPIAFAPPRTSSCAVARAPSRSRSATATAAPCAAYTSAMRLPMPLAAPVTIATLPSSCMRSVLCRGRRAAPQAKKCAACDGGAQGSVMNLLLETGRHARSSALQQTPAASHFARVHDSALAPAAARIDVEVLELAVQVGALHSDRLRQLADAAAGGIELVQQVGALELLARLAQRQVEVEAGSDARDRRGHLRGGLAERGLELLQRDIAATAEPAQALHEVAQLAQVARPGVVAQPVLHRDREVAVRQCIAVGEPRSEEHTSELQSPCK